MRKKILTSEDKEELRYCAECKVSFVEEQNLTDNQKAIARKNIGVSESGGSGGGLSEEELQEAVDDALRQAKESGEFDGYTPVKGVDYFDGKDGKDGTDYVLTDSDKSEIAEEAAKLVDVPSGGGGGNEVYVLSAGETLEDAPEEADIVIDPYAEGEFSDPETDTTLTQPGKAADAEAVGQALAEKIGAEELNTAVSNALTNAKESGLFDGKDGEDGQDGKDGYTPVKGVDYFDGKDGYTPVKDVDYFDGKDGKDGQDGQNGYTPQKGVDYFDGEDGYTPQKGVDYFDGKDGKDGADYVLTDADKAGIAEEAAKLVDVDVPEKLPNPHALTFTGAVTATYDGSEALNVVIPSGGGGTGGASVELDSTLTEQGKAADAKAVGDALSSKADITSVPNSATVNADNELVMQRADGDAVAELFKVALPAGGGSGMEELATFTTEEEVQSLTILLTRDIAKRVGDAGNAYLTCNIKKSQEDTNTDYGKVTARYINARANGSLMVDYPMISAQPIVPRTDQGHAYIDYKVVVEKNVILWASKKYTKLQIGAQNPTLKEEGLTVKAIGFEDRTDNVYKITIESTTKMGVGTVFKFGVI